MADLDPIAQKAYDYYNSNSYGGITYGKTASVLLTLEGIIGEDTMAKAMHVYFMKYRFTHPTKEDFLKTIEEVSGKNLRWYFDQAIYGTQVMDYKVLRIESLPVNWYEQEEKRWQGRQGYRLSLLRLVAAQGRFRHAGRGGDQVRERRKSSRALGWSRAAGRSSVRTTRKRRSRRRRLIPTTRSRLTAMISITATRPKRMAKPARKVTNYWRFVTQWLGQAMAWWAV